jgi:ubiquinone/menaquinone biosynthesis C-methylase UbiE
LFARIWELYFRILQGIGNWKYPEWKAIVEELPELIRKTDWVSELVRILGENGFSEIRVQPVTFGFCTIVTARRG